MKSRSQNSLPRIKTIVALTEALQPPDAPNKPERKIGLWIEEVYEEGEDEGFPTLVEEPLPLGVPEKYYGTVADYFERGFNRAFEFLKRQYEIEAMDAPRRGRPADLRV